MGCHRRTWPPRSSPQDRRSRRYTREQARILLDVASKEGDGFEALYVVALHWGLREGELLGLKWDDEDLLEASTLAVRRTLSETRTAHKCKTPQERQGTLRKAL
jgi:integrase